MGKNIWQHRKTHHLCMSKWSPLSFDYSLTTWNAVGRRLSRGLASRSSRSEAGRRFGSIWNAVENLILWLFTEPVPSYWVTNGVSHVTDFCPIVLFQMKSFCFCPNSQQQMDSRNGTNFQQTLHTGCQPMKNRGGCRCGKKKRCFGGKFHKKTDYIIDM